MLAFLFNLMNVMLDLSIPFYLKEIMTYLQDGSGVHGRAKALVFVGLILVTSIVFRISRENVIFYQQKLGAKASQALTGLIYSKVLKISNATNKLYKKGDIITFIQVDSRKLLFLFETLPSVSKLPFQIVFCVIYLYLFVGWTFMIALGIITIFVIGNYFLAIATAK
jgi:ABC-type bacteriocin/lantibiotic exporter with double-glycine peptidase domain